MRMIVLGDKEVEIITFEDMVKRFGSATPYAWKDGNLYITQETLEREKRKIGKHLSTEEIVEDIYIEARQIITGKTKRIYPTVWNELSRRRVDPKYRKPINV